MSFLVELVPFALLGALGSMHCVGMCGGFALSAVRGCASSCGVGGDSLRAIALFGLGKAMTYGVLGLALAQILGWGALAGSEVFGASAAAVGRQDSAWSLVAPTLVVLAGLFLVASGLHQLGLWRWPARLSILRRPLRGLQRALAPLGNAGGGAAGALGTGILTGLLPCGLSWSAFVMAATQPAPLAALGLFAFGFATVPALATFSLGSQLFSVRVRKHGMRLCGVLLVVFGVRTLFRANALEGGGEPPVCHVPALELE